MSVELQFYKVSHKYGSFTFSIGLKVKKKKKEYAPFQSRNATNPSHNALFWRSIRMHISVHYQIMVPLKYSYNSDFRPHINIFETFFHMNVKDKIFYKLKCIIWYR